ncbi:MAG: hypothetical protein ACF8R7_07065 [Phycisphaerales bacterium JB039]
MSSFNSLDLFGSGPHRFQEGRRGQVWVEPDQASPAGNSTTLLGERELDVVVTGRLVAATEAALWDLRDDITDQLTDPPTSATLVDQAGAQWTDMSFLEFRVDDRIDRGRAFSVGYRALFRRLASEGA